MVLTYISLLIPAFSLLLRPPSLSFLASSLQYAPLPLVTSVTNP